jgi:hypothetical protein
MRDLSKLLVSALAIATIAAGMPAQAHAPRPAKNDKITKSVGKHAVSPAKTH